MKKQHCLVSLLLTSAFAISSAPQAGAITITIDYTHDVASDNFFNSNLPAKAALEAAAAALSSAITSNLGAVNIPASITGINGGTTASINWDLTYTNPSTGISETIAAPNIAANTFIVYVGMRELSGTTLAQGGPGGYSYGLGGSGPDSGWPGAITTLSANSQAMLGRGAGPTIFHVSDTTTYGAASADLDVNIGATVGNLWFDNDTDEDGFADDGTVLDAFWHFNHLTSVPSGEYDFYSVALHEIMHTLGVGTSSSWDAKVSGTNWTGSEAIALNGTGIGLVSGDGAHVSSSITSPRVSDGIAQTTVMSPSISNGTRRTLTQLDLALLRDIGWSTIPEPSVSLLVVVGAGLVMRRRKR